MSEPTPRFTGIFLPVEILEMEELSIFEVMLLSYIGALYSKKEGGCFASNEYLAKRLRGVKPTTIVKSLTHLRKLGLIEDISFDGRRRVIRSLVEKYVHESQSNAGLDLNPMQDGEEGQSYAACDKNPMQRAKDITPPTKNNSIHENKEENKDMSSANASDVCNLLFSFLKKQNKAFHIISEGAWKRNATKILKKYPVEKVKEVIHWIFEDETSEKAAFWRTAIPSPAALYRGMNQIVPQMEQKTPKEKEQDHEEERMLIVKKNKKWAKKIISSVHFSEQRRYMEAGDTCVYIKNVRENYPLGYSDPSFQKIIINKLRSWQIEVKLPK